MCSLIEKEIESLQNKKSDLEKYFDLKRKHNLVRELEQNKRLLEILDYLQSPCANNLKDINEKYRFNLFQRNKEIENEIEYYELGACRK